MIHSSSCTLNVWDLCVVLYPHVEDFLLFVGYKLLGLLSYGTFSFDVQWIGEVTFDQENEKLEEQMWEL